MIKRIIAEGLHFFGFKPSYSTGIDGGKTCGYGILDNNGYWEYPLKTKFKKKHILILVKAESLVGKHLGLETDEYIKDDTVADTALFIANKQYRDFKNNREIGTTKEDTE